MTGSHRRGDGRRLDRHGAARIVRRVTRWAGITKPVGPPALRPRVHHCRTRRRSAVRAENRVRRSDQQSCSPSRWSTSRSSPPAGWTPTRPCSTGSRPAAWRSASPRAVSQPGPRRHRPSPSAWRPSAPTTADHLTGCGQLGHMRARRSGCTAREPPLATRHARVRVAGQLAGPGRTEPVNLGRPRYN